MTVVSQLSSHELFTVDLNSVSDDNLVVALVGRRRPQVVPNVGDAATVVDEDGAFYDATVVGVFPDHRVYLRLNWASKRSGMRLPDCINITYPFVSAVSPR